MDEKRNIINFIDERHDESFQLFIRGHLYLEALLSEIIQRSFKEPEALSEIGSMFYRKVKLVRAIGRISESHEGLLLSINQIRNRLAHKLEFSLEFETAYELVKKAHLAGIDFSDDSIHSDKNYSKDNYDVLGIVSEVICNTFSEIIWANEDLFSTEDISKFLC